MGERKYWVSSEDKVSGPFTRQQMRKRRKTGLVASFDLLRRDGTAEWRPVDPAMARWAEPEQEEYSGISLKWVGLFLLAVTILVVMAWGGWMGWKQMEAAMQPRDPFAEQVHRWVITNLPGPQTVVVRQGALVTDPKDPGHRYAELDIRASGRSGAVEVKTYRFEFDALGQITSVKIN